MAEQRTRPCGGCFVCAGRVVAPMEDLTCESPIPVDEHGRDITIEDQLRQRLAAAEREVARVREVLAKPGHRCLNPWPCTTIRTVDGDTVSKGE